MRRPCRRDGATTSSSWSTWATCAKGVTAERAPEVAYAMEQVRGICLAGIGTNLACYGGVIPTVKTMELLLEVKEKVERRLGRRLERVSGGTSANLKMVLEQQMPPGITELRIGEGILLGNEAVCREAIPGCYADAFLLKAEVIEVQKKPSKPIGEIGQDAFGNVPYFEDRGIRRRALLALGRQDVDPEGLIPLSRVSRSWAPLPITSSAILKMRLCPLKWAPSLNSSSPTAPCCGQAPPPM